LANLNEELDTLELVPILGKSGTNTRGCNPNRNRRTEILRDKRKRRPARDASTRTL